MPTIWTPLIERQPERAVLLQAVAQAVDGTGGVLRVMGAPGIGKTRLLQTIAEEAPGHVVPERVSVRYAAGGEYEQDVAFGVVRELLAPLADGAVGKLTPAVLGLLDRILAGTAAPTARTPDAGAVLNALLALVSASASTTPLVLVVDDLQWVDEDSIRFLAFLARRITSLPVVFVAGVRVPDGSGNARWRPLRSPATIGTDVVLSPLSRGGTAELAEATFGTPVEASFVTACHEVAGGNPLLATALLRALAEDDIAPVGAAAEAVLARRVPDDLADWVGQRVNALGGEAVAVARAVAVLGDDAPIDRVGRLASQSRAVVVRAGDALRGGGVFASERSAFVHPLVRAAVHDAIPAGARGEAHREAAELVVGDPDGLARAASHLQQTPAAGDARVVDLLLRAGERALGEGAVDAATRAWRRALAEPATGDRRVTLLSVLGELVAASGDPEGVTMLQLAHTASEDPVVRAQIALRLCRVTFLHADGTTVGKRLARAIDELGGAHDGEREELEAYQCLLAHVSLDLREALRPALREVCRRAEDGQIQRPSLQATVALELAQQGPIKQAIAFSTAALAEMDPALGLGGPRSMASIALTLCERHYEALAAYDQTIAVGTRAGALVDVCEALGGRARVRLALGDVEAAEADGRAAVALLPSDAPSIVDGCKYGSLALVLLETDRVEEALQVSATLDRLTGTPLADASPTKTLVVARARALLAVDRSDEALALLQALEAWCARWEVRTPSWPGHSELLPIALRDVGRPDEARAAAVDALERARSLGLREATAIALRVAGMIEGGEPGIVLLQEAAAQLGDSPARLEQIRVRVELGAALRRAGQRRDARAPLQQARDLASRCGALTLERRAHDELLASGARPRRATLQGPEALTPSERRIAELAATGLDNPAIARTLVLSRKTIEMHLSHVYRKLGVSGRGQLAALIGRPSASPGSSSSADDSSSSPSALRRPAA